MSWMEPVAFLLFYTISFSLDTYKIAQNELDGACGLPLVLYYIM